VASRFGPTDYLRLTIYSISVSQKKSKLTETQLGITFKKIGIEVYWNK